MDTDEEMDGANAASKCKFDQRGRFWTAEETEFIIGMYKKNLNNIGPGKVFRTKIHLWNKITMSLNKTFDLHRSTIQCIGRYKSLQRKSKNISIDAGAMSSSEEDNEDTLTIAEVIRSTLLEIHELKEEAKERRHRERMQLLEQFLRHNKTGDNVSVQDHDRKPNHNNVSVDHGVQKLPPTRSETTSTQIMREKLLEMQRKKMEDRERKQRTLTEQKPRLFLRQFQ